MDYQEAMAFLEDTKKYGSQLGLTSIRNLMAELGDIQDQVPVVHIAGTNGKGSVGAMLSSVLVEAGYRVGRFNTPDVFCYEEEFLENGNPIAKERLAELFTQVSDACRKLAARGLVHPTRFEVETAAAFLWFYQEQFDIALVEVGMGGETDATNLIRKPLLSILTSISMDHMKFLGNSVAEIAGVKAGIIKEGCPVVTMPQKEEAMAVIQKTAENKKAPLFYSTEVPAEQIHVDRTGTGFTTRLDGEVYPISLGVHGLFQIENARCVIRALEYLKSDYPRITTQAICDGLQKTVWHGRFEQIGSNPIFIVDGAHNEGAVRQLRKTLDERFPGKRFVYLMAVLADKEYETMIKIMFLPGDKVYTMTPPNPRALTAEELAEVLQKQNIDAVYCENAKTAVSYAMDDANAEDVILAFGSLYNLNAVFTAYKALQNSLRK